MIKQNEAIVVQHCRVLKSFNSKFLIMELTLQFVPRLGTCTIAVYDVKNALPLKSNISIMKKF